MEMCLFFNQMFLEKHVNWNVTCDARGISMKHLNM